MTGICLTGLTHGEMKEKDILYLVEHIEQRVGAIDIIKNGKTSGFDRAMFMDME